MYDEKRENRTTDHPRDAANHLAGAGGCLHADERLNELPQDKTINIMLSLTLWAFGLVGLWFDFLVPEPVAPEADKEKVEKDRKTAFALGVAGTAAILVIFVMQVITGSIIPFAQG